MDESPERIIIFAYHMHGSEKRRDIIESIPVMVAPFIKRPTSPLGLEYAAVSPDDILYTGSDDEDTTEQRHRKRRRVEELGQKYLEGKPLFILSASLRGPLGTGWVNPWAKKKREPTGYPRSGLTEKERRAAHLNPTLARHVGSKAPSPTMQSDTSAAVHKSTTPNRITRQSKTTPAPAELPRNTEAQASNRRSPIRTTDSKAPIEAQTPPDVSNSWLKSDEIFLNAQPDDARPATPTPVVQPLPSTVHHSGFTPINRQVAPVQNLTVATEAKRIFKEPPPTVLRHRVLGANKDPTLLKSRETDLTEADGSGPTSPGSAEKIMDDENIILQPKQLFAVPVSQASRKAVLSNPESPQGQTQSESRKVSAITTKRPEVRSHESKATPHELPPSTNLAEFQYRLASKRPTSSSKNAILSSNNSFAQQMKAAKARAEAQSIKRLSFTSSGALKSFGSPSTSQATSISAQDSRALDSKASVPRQGTSYELEPSKQSDTLSNALVPVSTEGQLQANEAQQVSVPSAPSGALPSGPSMHPVEQTSHEAEDDSYIDLSTQAAISKAQRSFQNHLVSPIQASWSRPHGTHIQASPTAHKTPATNLPPIPLSLARRDTSDPNLRTPGFEPPSTQDMMNAISPFVVTTMKKPISLDKSPGLPKRTAFAPSPLPSPSHTFGTTRRSLSMSTSSESPSPVVRKLITKSKSAIKPPPILSRASTSISKPGSTTTSTAFSIAPNGTLTEVYQQDGQQRYDVGPATGMGEWDLDEAIEEAGSFLATGAWDVEKEARKEADAVSKGSGR